MNKKIIFFVAICLNASSAAPITPIFPSQNNELRAFGDNPAFKHVVHIFLLKRSKDISGCSAVKVRWAYSASLYLTAAHCLTGAEMILVNQKKASAFFLHPFYEIAPKYDLAAFIVPGEDDSGGS